ncbi:hypothetical protein GGR57DRAFT_471395 [Xylariaceae sp. FL1272]|nr:hypothetical protein GGR57DRAFT_471395 [Xylariaceae sp. FL1272]
MTDITPAFNGLLKKHEAPSTRGRLSLDNIEDFLKEAYRINSHITSLHTELRAIRQSYLSTAQPRKNVLRSAQKDRQAMPLSDREREEIDANAKKMLRQLDASIRGLADVEKTRADVETQVIYKKFSRGLGALGSWAAGGISGGKSPEHIAAEEKAKSISTHRDGVLWLLRHHLQECAQTQQRMMEIRIMREVEKNRSVLAKARAQDATFLNKTASSAAAKAAMNAGEPPRYTDFAQQPHDQLLVLEETPAQETQANDYTSDLTQEQLQIFAEENHAMLEHYESTLDQVRTAEQSLMEISELQTRLIGTLVTQQESIDVLVGDAELTAENIAGGNKQLAQATKRPGPAKYVFFATCGLCTFLVIWDLII